MLYNSVMFARLQLQDPRVRRNIIWGIILVSILLLVVSLWVWWQFVFSSPRRVFEGMLETSLKTSSFTKRIEQSEEGQKLDQSVRVQTDAQDTAHSITVLSQGGESAASVTTEGVGTLNNDFVRYTDIKTSEKSQSGSPLNFSSVLNVWGRAVDSGNFSAGQLYSDTVLGVIPIARLSAAQKAELLNFIRDKQIYKTDYSSVERKKLNGRSVFVYKAEVKTELYVEMLKKFASMIGLKHLEDLDPDAYKDSPPIEFEISVDVLSRQLQGIKYSDSGRQETYSGYGALSEVQIPDNTITVEELQERLQNIR